MGQRVEPDLDRSEKQGNKGAMTRDVEACGEGDRGRQDGDPAKSLVVI